MLRGGGGGGSGDGGDDDGGDGAGRVRVRQPVSTSGASGGDRSPSPFSLRSAELNRNDCNQKKYAMSRPRPFK